MTYADGKPQRALTCQEAGEHRFNADGQCIFCPATEVGGAHG